MRNISPSIFFWLALISSGVMGCHNGLVQKEPSWTTFILVRHAEKAGSDRLSGLTSAGTERAKRLAGMLSDAPVKAVYSTDYTRTKATAEPTATSHQLEVQLYMSDKLDSLSQALRVRHKEGVVLIVGHSNTTPDLANSFIGEEKFLTIAETDYSKMYIVTCREDQRCSAILFRF